MAATFLALMTAIVCLSVREWALLLARRKLVVLRESDPVWLPDFTASQPKPLHAAGLLALGFALLKELSGEAQLARAQKHAARCQLGSETRREAGSCKTGQRVYLEVTEARFKGVRRCC